MRLRVDCRVCGGVPAPKFLKLLKLLVENLWSTKLDQSFDSILFCSKDTAALDSEQRLDDSVSKKTLSEIREDETHTDVEKYSSFEAVVTASVTSPRQVVELLL